MGGTLPLGYRTPPGRRERGPPLAEFAAARDIFMRGRAPSLHNARVRELAAAHGHVALVDFERLLHARAPEGIGCNFFGDETYCDQFHPNAKTHRMIAASLLEKMREMGLISWRGSSAR